MLKFFSPTPTKVEIARSVGKTEGAIRALYKQLSNSEIEKNNSKYKIDNYPFVKAEEYLQYVEDSSYDLNKLQKLVEDKKLAGTFYTDGNGIKNLFIPPITNQVKNLKELYSDNNIKLPIIISIGNHKGGVNKTTNTTNISAVLAYLGYKILIVDFDPQGNASASFGVFEGDYSDTIIDLITSLNDDDIEERVKNSIINIDLSSKFENGILGKLDLIANNATMSEKVEDLPTMTRNLGTIENTLDRILSYIKADYDFILIDLPPRTDVILRAAMMASDYFIISLNPQPFAKMGMPNILKPIQKYENVYKQEKGKDFKVLGGIVSFYEQGVTVQDINYEQMKNDIQECTNDTSSLFDTIIPKSTIIQESQVGDGATLFAQPCAKITRSYFDLALEIIERVLVNELSEDN